MGHWGGTLVAFTVLVVFLLGIGVGRLWRFSAFVAFMRHAGWSVYFIYLFFCVWRGVACSVYGALGWGACGVHSVCSVYEAFGLVAFFCGIYSVSNVYGALEWDPCGVYGVCIVYGVLGLDVCGFHSICIVYRVLGPVILVAFRLLVVFMGDWGGTRLAFTALVVVMGHWR